MNPGSGWLVAPRPPSWDLPSHRSHSWGSPLRTGGGSLLARGSPLRVARSREGGDGRECSRPPCRCLRGHHHQGPRLDYSFRFLSGYHVPGQVATLGWNRSVAVGLGCRGRGFQGHQGTRSPWERLGMASWAPPPKVGPSTTCPRRD